MTGDISTRAIAALPALVAPIAACVREDLATGGSGRRLRVNS
jgi:hypothetical protein